MRSIYAGWFRATFALVLVCTSTLLVKGEPQLVWNHKATRQYLDARIAWWLDWSSAARGQGTACTSCHTTVPYALALPALAKLSGTAPVSEVHHRLVADVRTRVVKWDQLVSIEPEGKDPLTPIFGGPKRDTSLDTESVLNAVVLVTNDPRAKGKLGDAASRALDIMWSRQQADGKWRWLEFGLRPWEKDGDYYGATLAAVAAGVAGNGYARSQDDGIKLKLAALRRFLKSRLAEKPLLHNRALGLWAASYLTDLFSDNEKRLMIADLFAIQRPDGGWSLRDLGKSNPGTDAPGWEIIGAHPRGAVSDGYATGLVVLAVKQANVSRADERLKKGIAWLLTQQAADGTWPTVYVNKERDPEGNIGKFNRDAGAAFAALALSESK